MALIQSTAIPSGATYELEQSLRFAGGNLSRTPSSAGNRRKWSWSGWVKRAELGTYQTIWAAKTNTASIFWSPDNILRFEQYNGAGGYNFRRNFNPKMRDPSAWYHMLFIYDSAQGTETDRNQFYLNGVKQTIEYTYDAMPQNFESEWNNTEEHYIGNLGSWNYEGYVAEVHFIDGLVKAPADFGETGDYGEWKPIEYEGTYGTNGFYLPFKQDYTVEGFSATTYPGNGTTGHTIGGVGFSPDLLWLKERTSTSQHRLFDTVRGASKRLVSDDASAEATDTSNMTSFNTDGFTLGNSGSVNASGDRYIAWSWDMGGSNATNTNGNITSTVRANTSYGQSIVSWVGNRTANATIGHGLSSTPELVIIKNRSDAGNWRVHDNISGKTNGRMDLDATGAENTSNYQITFQSTTFNLGSESGQHEDWNENNENIIAYCFHSVTGYSKFGTYDGDGTYDGSNAVNVGFTPAFVMIKCTNDAESWWIFDSTRSPLGTPFLGGKRLAADSSNAELSGGSTGSDLITFTSTGFKMTGQGGGTNGGSGQKYNYMAFADKREYAYWLDQSGNNNDFTSNNLTESDISVDSPTNNFCTWNPLSNEITANATLAEGNLKGTTGQDYNGTGSTMNIFDNGKTYIEFTPTAIANDYYVGILASEEIGTQQKLYNGGPCYVYRTDGLLIYNPTNNPADEANVSTDVNTFGVGDIGQLAIDTTANKIWIGKNNVWQMSGTQNPSTGTGGYTIASHAAGYTVVFGTGSNDSSNTGVVNFGQDSSFAGTKTAQGNQDGNDIGDFYYTPPTGFLALCTKNLPDVAVVPSEHFNTILYTGDGASTHAVTGVGFQPDWVWLKHRTATYHHSVWDSVRGVHKQLYTSGTHAEADESTSVKSFDTDGFTLGNKGNVNNDSGAADNFVAWNWKANGSGSSNTNGTITSTVSANVDAGFSIATWTGSGSAGTIGHGLSKTPEMIITFARSNGDSHRTYHSGLTDPTEDYLKLDSTSAETDGSFTTWNSTAPTSSVFSVWYDNSNNGSGRTYLAYAFHSVDGYSKVGSYTGNSSTDGTFIYTGFRPAYFLCKNIAQAEGWEVWDGTREPYNLMTKKLSPNTTEVEWTSSTTHYAIDFLSNGVKLRTTYSAVNNNAQTFIYIAFAETPFKYSNAR